MLDFLPKISSFFLSVLLHATASVEGCWWLRLSNLQEARTSLRFLIFRAQAFNQLAFKR